MIDVNNEGLEVVAWKVCNPVTGDELLCSYKPMGLMYTYQALCDQSEALAAIAVLRERISELEQDLAYFPATVRSLAETVTKREAKINQLRAELAAIKVAPVVKQVVMPELNVLEATLDDVCGISGALPMGEPVYSISLSEVAVECDHCPTSGGCVNVCMKAK